MSNASNNNNNNHNNSNEEDALLATLHASRRNQSAYEEEVIREATHALAPSLPSSSVGLPALDGLSTTGVAPVAQVHEVLGNVRRKQEEEDEQGNTDLHCFKEQILLEYLETQCGVPQQGGAGGAAAAGGGADDDGYNGGPSIRQQRRQERRKRQYQKEPPSWSRTTPTAMPNVEDTGAIPRRSVKRRKVQQIVDEQDDPLQLSAKQRQEIAERRLKRQQQRQARRHLSQQQQQQQAHLVAGNDKTDDEEAEAELDDGDQKLKAVENTTDTTQQQNETEPQPEAEAAVVPAAATLADALEVPPPLVCPVCETTIETTSTTTTTNNRTSDRDALLAQHMQNDCRPGRRSRRARAAVSSTPTMALPSSHVAAATAPARRQSTTRRKKATEAKTPTPPLDDLEEWAYEDRVDDWIENGLSRMKEMKERVDTGDDIGDDGPWQQYGEGFFVPAWIHRRLFGYQREGLQWMWGLHQQGCGGCLGDEMGLGKTVSVSSYLGSLVSNRKIKSILIVVPATMLQHWLKELAVWAPGLRRILVHTSGEVDGRSRAVTPTLFKTLSTWLQQVRKDRVYEAIDAQDEESNPPHSFCGTGYAVLTTYENVRRNPEIYVAHSWSYVVLDEAQKIRNPDADVTVAMKRLRTPHRICMTGTPIQNDFSELWSIFDFCFPSRLGTLPAFQQELADPIKRGGYSNATPMQVQLAYRCALVVRDLINPYLLRRQKKDVKEVAMMPSKTEHVLFCRLSETQRALYEAYLRSEHVSKVMRGSSNLLGAITMLRKICNHPDLVCDPASVDTLVANGFNVTAMNYKYESESDDDDDDYNGDESMMERSGKLAVLSKILPLWKKQGHRVLIFCQWRKMLNVIERFVNIQGWRFGRLDGNTNVAARQRLVDNFNQDESYFGLLCTTRTGGVGLNLTGANRIVLYDPDWNPSTDAQARERAWRFGQEKEVTIYRLITAGSVEEKIYQRQIFKTALSNRVLQDPRQRRLFSQRDLRDLFALKADTGSLRGGGDGATDTAQFTRGIGVVDPTTDVGNNEDGIGDDDVKDDNEDTLKTVMKSKGLAGVFDHHFVEQDASRKSVTVREMEAKAKEVARAATVALRESVRDDEPAPAEPRRFGGGLASAGASSSMSLLEGLKRQKAAVNGNGEADEETKKYAKVLKTVQEFVRRRRPTTDEILTEFEGSVLSEDVAIFRRLLKSVAVLQNGKWHLLK